MNKEATAVVLQPKTLMSEDKALKHALKVIGYQFTAKLIRSSGNPKIKDFCNDAEDCLEMVQKWNNGKSWATMWFSIVFGLFGLAALWCYEYGWLEALRGWVFATSVSLGILVAAVGFMYASTRFSYGRPGGTAMMVAQAWRPWRRQVLAWEVVQGLANNIQAWYGKGHNNLKQEIDCGQLGGPELQKVLKITLETIVQRAVQGLKRAERDGVKRDCKHSRNQFAAVDKIGQSLGFEPLDWKMLNA